MAECLGRLCVCLEYYSSRSATGPDRETHYEGSQQERDGE